MREILGLLLAALALGASGCGGGDDEAGSGPQAVPFDQAFIDAMVPHHRQAIEMAEAALDAGLGQTELVQIATDVVATQQREIDQMLEWREEWFGSRELGPVLPEVLGLPAEELGMAHGADELADAHDVDAAFADLMIGHHQGAVAMAVAAERRASHEELKELAGAIVEAQEREIAIMEAHAGMEH